VAGVIGGGKLRAIDGEGFRRLSFEDFDDPFEEARPRRFRAVWRRDRSSETR